jgi:D-proline reductase (dithiol) PrdB
LGDASYRLIPGDLDMNQVVMSHISTNFDRSGFQQDANVVLPIERLRELAAAGKIGSVADYHYSFMGATDPYMMAPTVKHLASLLKKDNVDAILLAPV